MATFIRVKVTTEFLIDVSGEGNVGETIADAFYDAEDQITGYLKERNITNETPFNVAVEKTDYD